MSDVVGVVRSLLHALRLAGHASEADIFEHEFTVREWILDLTDQMRVLERLQALSSRAATSAGADTPRPVVLDQLYHAALSTTYDPLPQPPDEFAGFEAFSPWVATLPGGWEFVADVHALLAADRFSALADGLARLFGERLGFEPFPLDETPRVATQRTLTRVLGLAKHDDFFVAAVESTYAGAYTTSFEPVFQLHPRCIIFALERGSRIRVVTRRVGAGTTKLIGQRILRGRGSRAFPDDDVFVWAARLAALEPAQQEDGRALAIRADDVFRKPASSVVRAWESAPIDPTSIPGAPWESSAAEDLRRFLQVEAPDAKLHFGLQAELCTSFPWSTRDGRTVIRYHGYRIVDLERDARRSEEEAQTLAASIDLDLEFEIRNDDGSSTQTRFIVPAAIAIPSDDGIFVLDGERFRFSPGLHRSDDAPSTEDLELEFDGEDSEDDDEAEAETESSLRVVEADPATPTPPDGDDADVDAYVDGYHGEGLVPLLRWAVGRQLRGLAVRFAKSRIEFTTLARVRAWLGRVCDSRSRLRLTARSALLPHLEPATRDGLRTIVIDPSSSLPAWTCLELTRALDPNRAYPVAGARVGPAGALCAPTLDAQGRVRLHAGPTKSNPRVDASPGDSLPALWISSPLQRFSTLPLGAVGRPLAVALEGATWTGLVFTDGTKAEAFCVPRESLSLPRRKRRWVFDIPRHSGTQSPPEPVVQAGVEIEAGDPVAVFDHPWADAASDDHHLVEIGRKILQWQDARARVRERQRQRAEGATEQPTKPAEIDDDRGDLGRSTLRCPSGVRGRVERICIVPVVERHGIVTRYRITLDTSVSLGASHAVLPDGQIVPIRLRGREDLPWNPETGETAEALVCSVEEPAPDTNSTAPWLDGRTGAPLPGSVSEQTITLLLDEPARPPDPCLRYRALDGWGRPRTWSDPSITLGELRQLVATHPSEAESMHAVIRQVHGQAPSATSIFELCSATRLPPPAFVPRDWIATERAEEGSGYDPMRTSIHRPSVAPYAVEHGPWRWMCDCGALVGPTYVQVACASCETTVKKRWVGMNGRVIRLPLPVLHPWRKRLVGALLGLVGDEIIDIARKHDCSSLYEPTQSALEYPTRNLATRMALCSDPTEEPTLAAELAALEHAVALGLSVDDLWITDLDILSPRLLFDGYRTGAPDLLSSPLTRHYRRIQGLARLEFGTNTTLRRALSVELQRSVDELFGDVDESPPREGTLAALWHRVWPTTAPDDIEISVPGLFEHCDARDLRGSTAAQLLASTLPSTDASWKRGVLTTDGVDPVPVPAPIEALPTDAAQWRERAAWSRCSGSLLVRLAAICLGIDHQPSIIAALHTLPQAAVVEEVESLGSLLLRELLTRLRPPRGRPSVLLDLLEKSDLTFLPRDRNEATARVESRLEAALPGVELGDLFVRAGLARILSGFWCGRPTAESPRKWIWAPHADDAPKEFRRAVPAITSAAWRGWPGFELMTDPIAAALQGWTCDTTGGHAGWFGLPAPPLPPEEDLTAVTRIHEHQPLAGPPALAAGSPPTEPIVRVVDDSLAVWVRTYRQPRNEVTTS